MENIRYNVNNWPEYNQALKNRFRLTMLISEEVVSGWYAEPSGKRGAPQTYSDLAIEFVLTLRVLFNLPLRGCEGFAGDVLRLLGFDIECPDYTTLCRRGKALQVSLPRQRCGSGPASDRAHGIRKSGPARVNLPGLPPLMKAGS